MDFKLIHRIVKNLQDTIANTAVGSSRALMAHTFSTKIKNFPKVQKVNGIVTVTNQKRVEKELKINGVTLKTILKWLKSFKLPKEIKVSNFPSFPKQLAFPKEFKISNFPKFPEFPKNIRISNQPTKELKEVSKRLESVEKAIKGLKLNPTIKVQAAKADKVVVPPANVSVTQQEIDYERLAELIPVTEQLDIIKLAEAIASEVAGLVVSVGGGGGTRKEGLDDLTRAYNIADKDDVGATKYFGFTGRTGNWYILRENTTNQTYRYVKGSSGYTTNWTGRAALSFDYYNEVF